MNILIYNRKGGVGKTTVADEIMFSLERSGTSAAYIDLDDQDSSIHTDQSDRAESADVVVVDTPGAINPDTEAWMENADVIVIPTNASGRDIPMMLAALDAAREYAPDSKRIIVVNRYNRYRAAGEFLAALQEAVEGGEVAVTLPASEAFQNAYLNDVSVLTQAPKTSAAYRTLGVVNAVREAAGLAPDPIDPQPIKERLERQAKLARLRKEIKEGK